MARRDESHQRHVAMTGYRGGDASVYALPAICVGSLVFLIFTIAGELGGRDPRAFVRTAFDTSVSLFFAAIASLWTLGFILQTTLAGLIFTPFRPGLHWVRDPFLEP